MTFARCVSSAIAVAGIAAGCTTGQLVPRSSSEVTTGASASTVVTAQELGRLVQRGTLMDALERVRPFMLSSRGTTPLVSVDGAPPAELSLLQTIPLSAVQEVRLQRSSSSVGHAMIGPNGDVIVRDVLAVTTWQGGRSAR